MEQQSSTSASPSPTPMPRAKGFFSGNRKVFIALGLLVLAIGYFGFTAFKNATVYYMSVNELVSGTVRPTETVRVAGKLVPESFKREDQGTLARFNLTDGIDTLPATYDGILPELFFNEQSQIVLEGRYDSSGTFHTASVVVKCPSKYESSGASQGSSA